MVDVLVECPTCGDPVSAGASRCECGERLTPRQPVFDPRCTCGGNGLCLHCAVTAIEEAQDRGY